MIIYCHFIEVYETLKFCYQVYGLEETVVVQERLDRKLWSK